MPAKKLSTKEKKQRVSKLNVWLYHYLNEECSTTFLNKTESARRAKYITTSEESIRQIGCKNFTIFNDKISTWFDEHGLSENALKAKLISLIDANETKFIKVKGFIDKKDLPEGSTSFGTSGLILKDKDGLSFGDGETLLGIKVKAIETQRKSLDMAFKIKGMNAPEKHEHTGKDGGPIEHDFDPEKEMKNRGIPIPDIDIDDLEDVNE